MIICILGICLLSVDCKVVISCEVWVMVLVVIMVLVKLGKLLWVIIWL